MGMVAVCGKSFMAAWNESDRLYLAGILCPSQAAPPGEKPITAFHIATMLSPYTAPTPKTTVTLRDTTMAHTLEVARCRSAPWISRATVVLSSFFAELNAAAKQTHMTAQYIDPSPPRVHSGIKPRCYRLLCVCVARYAYAVCCACVCCLVCGVARSACVLCCNPLLLPCSKKKKCALQSKIKSCSLKPSLSEHDTRTHTLFFL